MVATNLVLGDLNPSVSYGCFLSNWEFLEGWIGVQMIPPPPGCGTSTCGIYIVLVRIPSMKYIINIQFSFVFMTVPKIWVQPAKF